MTEMTDVIVQALLAIRWYLVLQLFGLVALPLSMRLFRWLPDRGYGMSKALGLLLAGWAFWLLATLGWLRNTAGGMLVALFIVGGAGLILYLKDRPSDLTAAISWREVLFSELFFAVAFAAWCIVRAHMPRIETAGGEKWMEIAFLRAILRAGTFPPHDPWLSGFAISYYYFGYVIMAMLTRLSATPPSIAFNLGVATLFALVCSGVAGLVRNLILVGATDEERRSGKAAFAGVLGALVVVVMGNLEVVFEVLHARGIGSHAFWRWLDIRALAEKPVPAFAEGQWAPSRFIWWWQASRVIRDYSPSGMHQEVIDEFPGFSFLLGERHPHVLALPFVLLALALAFNLYLKVMARRGPLEVGQRLLSDWPFAGWEFVTYAVCLGGLGFLNTWDFPIYLFIVAAAYALACMRLARPRPDFKFILYRFGLLFGSLLACGLLLYFPFWRSFQSQAGGVLPNLFNGTRLHQFLIMFGPLAFVAGSFVVLQARLAGVSSGRVIELSLSVLLGIVTLTALAIGLALLLIRWGVIPATGPISYIHLWMRGEPIPGVGVVPNLWGLIRQRLLLDPALIGETVEGGGVVLVRALLTSPVWTALGLTLLLVAVVLTLLKMSAVEACGRRDFVLLLVGTGALLILGVEFVYLKDNFGTRMNTIFKFYFQAWVLWGIAAGYGVATWLWDRRPLRTALGVVGVSLILLGLMFPLLAVPKRIAEHGATPTLDGAAYLARSRPADYAAITWLNENVAGAPVILETPGGSYQYEGRVSAHTGLPTLLGWAGHEWQWRGSSVEQDQRKAHIRTIYTSTDVTQALELLNQYDVTYVYVGPLERTTYADPAGLAKFDVMMDTAYDANGVTIYVRAAHKRVP